MTEHKPIKVIDLFAGPGGLGDGFSSLINNTALNMRNYAVSALVVDIEPA